MTTDNQPLNGNMVAARVASIADRKIRSLLLFIQAISMHLEFGGLQVFAAQFLARFANRVGSPSMHRFGMKPKQVYNAEQVKAVRESLGLEWDDCFGLAGEETKTMWGGCEDEDGFSSVPVRRRAEKFPSSYSASEFLNYCRSHVKNLPETLAELCINHRITAERFGLLTFHDLIGALLEFQREYAAGVNDRFVMTTIARKAFDALDVGLRGGKIVMVEGKQGVGKSEAAKAWCQMHQGEARYVTLVTGGKTEHFRAIARALGIGEYGGMSLQGRVEHFLQQSRIMLVIDEAHMLLPQSERISRQPEMVNWIYGLENWKVPIALVTTSMFTTRLKHMARQVTWNVAQFTRRIRHHVLLPESPTPADLKAIARKMLPDAKASCIDYLVSYAGPSREPLTNLVYAIEGAKLIAEEAGRDWPTFEDIETEITQNRVPSDLAKAQAFGLAPARKRSCKAPEMPDAEPLQERDEAPVNRVFGRPADRAELHL
jgi:hypothetical protein